MIGTIGKSIKMEKTEYPISRKAKRFAAVLLISLSCAISGNALDIAILVHHHICMGVFLTSSHTCV